MRVASYFTRVTNHAFQLYMTPPLLCVHSNGSPDNIIKRFECHATGNEAAIDCGHCFMFSSHPNCFRISSLSWFSFLSACAISIYRMLLHCLATLVRGGGVLFLSACARLYINSLPSNTCRGRGGGGGSFLSACALMQA